jgi:hypothetical protein
VWTGSVLWPSAHLAHAAHALPLQVTRTAERGGQEGTGQVHGTLHRPVTLHGMLRVWVTCKEYEQSKTLALLSCSHRLKSHARLQQL